jgi:hypothetical protein
MGSEIDNGYKLLIAQGVPPAEAAAQVFDTATNAGLTAGVFWTVVPKPLKNVFDRMLIDRIGTTGFKRFLLGRAAQVGEGAVIGAGSAVAQNVATGRPATEGVTEGATGMALANVFFPRGQTTRELKAASEVGLATGKATPDSPRPQLSGAELQAAAQIRLKELQTADTRNTVEQKEHDFLTANITHADNLAKIYDVELRPESEGEFPIESVPPVKAPAPAAPTTILPQHLAGAKPRYNFGGKSFDLQFASDVDKAAYIPAQPNQSKADADYLRFAMDATGMTEPQVRFHGTEVRRAIKEQARQAEPGTLTIPRSERLERVAAEIDRKAPEGWGEIDADTGQRYGLTKDVRNRFESNPSPSLEFRVASAAQRAGFGPHLEPVHVARVPGQRGHPLQGADPSIDNALALADRFGRDIEWFRGDPSTSGFHFRGKIFLNVDMQERTPVHVIAAHELTHWISRTHPDLHARLVDGIKRSDAFPTFRDRLLKVGYTENKIDHELPALFAEEVFKNPVRFEQLLGERPALMRRVGNAIVEWIDQALRKLGVRKDKSIFGVAGAVENLRAARKTLMAVMAEARERPRDTAAERAERADTQRLAQGLGYRATGDFGSVYTGISETEAYANKVLGNLPKDALARRAEIGPMGAVREAIKGKEMARISNEKKMFSDVFPKMLRATGLTTRNVVVAANRAVTDTAKWLKNNKRFKDYYEKDFRHSRRFAEAGWGRKLSDTEFRLFRFLNGVMSQATDLEYNTYTSLNGVKYFKENGNFDAVKTFMGPKDAPRISKWNPFAISGGAPADVARKVGVFNNLIKRFGGGEAGVESAIKFLEQPVSESEYRAFRQEMGYAGVGDIGAIREAVQFATGQTEMIPRMMILGKKVGPYTLNNLGDAR